MGVIEHLTLHSTSGTTNGDDMNLSPLAVKTALYMVTTPFPFISFFLSSSFHTASVSAMSPSIPRIIDSHLHVWADTDEAEAFPFSDGQTPPETLKNVGSASALLEQMQACKEQYDIVGALIIQPINYKFDHSYVTHAIQKHPRRFKGMMLHNPSLSAHEAVAELEDLVLKGYVGVRFNPYLWPKCSSSSSTTTTTMGDDTHGSSWTPMSTLGGSGLAVYERCAELNMPVGIMCFQGLQLHYDDIIQLLESSPKTNMILDHFGFTQFTKEGDAAFDQLVRLADFPQVVIKISALFRLNDKYPYERVRKERFEPLLKAFGHDRLMFGTDFPFVLDSEQVPDKYVYESAVGLLLSWMDGNDDAARDAILGGTAERLFGSWEVPSGPGG